MEVNYTVRKLTSGFQSLGFTFTNHYSTVSLCCPARVALLRGQAAHNTNITFVMPPGYVSSTCED